MPGSSLVLPSRACARVAADAQQRQVRLDLVALGDEADDRVGVSGAFTGHQPGQLLGVVDGLGLLVAVGGDMRGHQRLQFLADTERVLHDHLAYVVQAAGICSSQVDVRSRRSAVRM